MGNIEKGKSSNYLQNRILLSILLYIAILGILITTLSSYLYKHYLQKSLLQNAEVNLQFLADNIDNSMDNVMRLVRFCQTNITIGKYVENASGSLSNSAHERLNEEYQSNECAAYMHRVIVSGNNDKYLQLVDATYSNSRNASLLARELPYFQTALESDSCDFSIGFVPDSFYSGERMKNILPVIRPISARYNARNSGWVFVGITEELFTAPLAYYSRPEDSPLYLTLGEHIYLLTTEGCIALDSPYRLEEEFSTDFLTSSTKAYYITDHADDRRKLMLIKPLSEMEGCYVSQIISPQELNTQRTLFLTTVACIVLLVTITGLVVSYLLYRTVSLPILKLRHKISSISMGDFSRDTSIEWNHELGDIGRGINDMSESIVALMNQRLSDEKQKRDLEYQMLQSQINPHFIYNTLNSIKWMATIQGADGISEMTTALSRLLKSISKGTSLLVPLREELNLLQDYYTIQQYRYGGTITMNIHVTEESLYDCQIVKFTLQPLVENAVFHGIEPKGTAGTIDVLVEAVSENNMRITVADDGVGMSQEKADRLLTEDSDKSAEFFREIGISNVHKRLQYQFGPEYGITIETKEGEYTRMILLLPRIPADSV